MCQGLLALLPEAEVRSNCHYRLAQRYLSVYRSVDVICADSSDGTIGQANYSTAKAAISGLTRTLAIEGSRANINVNCLAPRAGTAMTMTVWPKEMIEAMKVGLNLLI